MTDHPLFDPSDPTAWPHEDGEPLTTEEVVDAVAELARRGLVELRFDDSGQMWVRATPDGHAAYAIESVFREKNLDDVVWPE